MAPAEEDEEGDEEEGEDGEADCDADYGGFGEGWFAGGG